MNGIFCVLLLAGVLFAAATGHMDAAQQALLSGGNDALALCASMAGAYALFGGMLGVLRESGVQDALARALQGPVGRLFRFRDGEEAALGDICVNLAANMLGMGGAATPAGLSAMRTMAKANAHGDTAASDAMLLFLVINATSVQLLPTTMIALRAQAGARQPTDIVLPTLLATSAATACGVVVCRVCAARGRRA